MSSSAKTPLRILTAVPICDGHDSPIITINLELARHGVEGIYLGYHCAASAIARAAVQEDVHAIGISSYNGGHLVFFREVVDQLRARGGGGIPVFGGGGGTITPKDSRIMKRSGVGPIFFAGTSLESMVRTILQRYRVLPGAGVKSGDRGLARAVTERERSSRPAANATAVTGKAPAAGHVSRWIEPVIPSRETARCAVGVGDERSELSS